MKKRLIGAVMVLAIVIGIFGVFASRSARGETGDLVKLLPDSDIVVVLDSQRLLTEVLPTVLASNTILLEKHLGKLDDLKQKTGIDLKNYDEVAFGIKTEKLIDGTLDMKPLLLARGKTDEGALRQIAKVVSNDNFQTETIGDRVVYRFDATKVIEKNAPKSVGQDDNSIIDKMTNKVLASFSKDMALTAYANDVVALGTYSRVKEVLNNGSHVSQDVLDLLKRSPDALARFGGILPDGLSDFFDLGDDELGATLSSIRQIQGGIETIDGAASLSIMAKTNTPENAVELENTLAGLIGIGRDLLGGSNSKNSQVYARMAQNIQMFRVTDEVILELRVPQSDIDILLAK